MATSNWLTADQRRAKYRQGGRHRLTARQTRRIRQKLNRHGA